MGNVPQAEWSSPHGLWDDAAVKDEQAPGREPLAFPRGAPGRPPDRR